MIKGQKYEQREILLSFVESNTLIVQLYDIFRAKKPSGTSENVFCFKTFSDLLLFEKIVKDI